MKILFITLEQSGRQIVKSILEDNFFKINKNQIFTFGMDDIYSEYKANRPPMPDELRLQLQPVKSICKAIGFPLIEIEGVEADDVIATITKMAKDAKYKCVVSSLDKDLMHLVEDPDTTLMNTMKHEIFNEDKVFEKFGVKPSQIRDLLA